MENFLKVASEILEQSSPSDLGCFGSVAMDYETMYDSLYSVEEPIRFSDFALQQLAFEPEQGMEQSEYYGRFIPELAHEIIGLTEEQVEALDGEFYNPEIIYLVNYKGEGEGWFLYESVKDKIAGKYISKYNYG